MAACLHGLLEPSGEPVNAGGQGCEPFPVSAVRGEAPSTIGRSELLPGHPIQCAGWLRDFVLGTALLQLQRRSRSRHGHHHNGCEAKSGWERPDHTVRSDRSRSITSGFTATGYRDLYVGMGWEACVLDVCAGAMTGQAGRIGATVASCRCGRALRRCRRTPERRIAVEADRLCRGAGLVLLARGDLDLSINS